jgi:23S rRNA pseudouridine1911/1915/1917 synthase
MRRVLEVNRGDARLRLDRLLVARLPEGAGLSRTRLAAWIRDGRVEVDGVPARRSAQRLRPGQTVALDLPEAPRLRHLAEARPLDVLYEDAALLAVAKPAGMVVHPTWRYPDGTLMNALLGHFGAGAAPATAVGGDAPRVHLVHRLDRETSGVMLIAKAPGVHARLARAMARRQVQKDYLAVVYGVPRAAKDRIDLRLRRDPTAPRMIASRDDGLPASTLVELLATSSGSRSGSSSERPPAPAVSLLRCTLITGRLHQIRVHLAGVGLPIVGDPLYGEPRWKGIADGKLRDACAAMPRQALHAWRLALQHPETGAPLTLIAPLPTDLQALLDAAGLADPAVYGSA